MASRAPQVTLEQAQKIVDHHRGEHTPITSFEEVTELGDITCPTTSIYTIHTSSPSPSPSSEPTAGTAHSYVLKASPPRPSPAPDILAGNPLSAELALLHQLATRLPPSVPVPRALAHSSSCSQLVPFEFLLLSHPSPPSPPTSQTTKTKTGKTELRTLASLRRAGALSARHAVLLDLRLGTYLKALHALDHDFFGLPDTPAAEQAYSWQEAVTLMLEEALAALEEEEEEEEEEEKDGRIDVGSVRKSLGRAIGFYLFDDCEWPAFVGFGAGAESVLVALGEEGEEGGEGEEEEPEIRGVLSYGLGNAVWGDPLAEAWFVDPSEALLEGYGGSPVVFPRQRTKRVWYTLLGALVALVQAKRGKGQGERAERARRTARECVEVLKDAPCY